MKNESSNRFLNNKILIIDDEPAIIESLKKDLYRDGYEIFSAMNGKEGLEIFEKECPVLIILDLKMPVMDGVEFLKRIGLKYSDTYLIIVITGHGDYEDIQKCFDLRVSSFLSKPYNVHVLRGMVRHSIELKQNQLKLIQEMEERKRAETHIRMLHRALEQSPCVVIITDTNGIIEYVNPKFTEITSYSPEELTGKTPRILKSGRASDETYKQLWSTITSGNEWHGEFHNRKKNGELYWESVSISGIKSPEGIITHYIKVAEDITHRKFIEDELIKSQCELEERVAERTTELNASLREKEELIVVLKESIENVKILKGLLPICCFCKKIRDDKGYWDQLELYIQKHPEADFTHTFCPECMKIHYPEANQRTGTRDIGI